MQTLPTKPTAEDIRAAIILAEDGGWVDPSEVPGTWDCDVLNAKGQLCGNGSAFSPEGAMALAWVAAWAPDALIDSYVEPGSVPFEVSSGWTFRLTPPQPQQAA